MAVAHRKLLFYTHALVGGGAEKGWAQIAAGLASRGHHVEFCVDWNAEANAHILPRDMKIHRLGKSHFLALLRLRSLLAKQSYFAAFSAVGASNTKLLAAAALSWSGVKTVLSQHGHFEAEHRFLGRMGYRLTPLTSRLATQTIVVSDALRDDLCHRFGADMKKVLRIYNAIALPPGSVVPSEAELQERDDVILAVGRLVAEKGHETLLRAMTRMPESTTLVICGEGPLETCLRATIEKYRLCGRVKLVGYHQDLGRFYRGAKALALPSGTEAFGNVVVEAMGYGLPVVVTRCGGPVEVLDGGQWGRIVPVGDARAMADALIQTLADPGPPSPRRKRAEAFAADHVLDQYEALLENLAGPAQ